MASFTMTASILGGPAVTNRLAVATQRRSLVVNAAKAVEAEKVSYDNDMDGSNGRRNLMFAAAAAAAVCSVAGMAVADEPKPGTPAAKKKPTTLTRRQRAIVVVAEDIEHMDHAADEAHEEHHDPVTDDECTELKLAYHGRKMKKFERPALEIEDLDFRFPCLPFLSYCEWILRKGPVTRAMSKRLQEDWARAAKEGPRVLMNLKSTKFRALLSLSLYSSPSSSKLLSMASYGGELLLDSSSP
ncbi:Photosystem II 5 kDa protein, chloroplastic [Glycine soja]|uniref:Photosystem II 5 kDa protein, chloroplastic n=1 Tax=Glycine soja TaxID=3848 RepID=A0A445GZ91_GLYSO|nr:Photosystem II 5 kDa protein, chloroplastic [Glycine soja]